MSGTVFDDLSKIADDTNLTEIENSYCVNCGNDGKTRMLLTEIPFFRQVVIMSFECPHCNYKNNELQPAQKISEKGIRYELKVTNKKDLSRQLVKTEWANIKIPEVEFEIKQQNGLITTIEGILDRAIIGLKQQVDHLDEQSKEKMNAFIHKMESLTNVHQQFTFIVEDISGNSFIENFQAPNIDPNLNVTNFIRTTEEDKLLGIYQINSDHSTNNDLKDEVLQFNTNCPNCNAACFTNMKLTTIPHFKDIVIMATNCDSCGNKTNEIKSGAGIEAKGIRITLKIKNEDDLKKDVVRSDTCNISIPELSLTLNSSGSGRYTTVQGLGLNMIEDLKNTNPFIDGDSTRNEIRSKIEQLKQRLENMIGLTVVLDDPCGNSFVQDADHVQRYERSWQQNQDLGLNDIKC